MEEKMKKILCILCAATFSLSAFAFDVSAEYQVVGNPKSVTRTDYSIASKFGEYFRTPSSKFSYKYDAKGKLLESSEFTPRDVLVNRIQNSFDESGNIVEQIGYNSENVLAWKSVLSYKGGLRKDCSEYGADGKLRSKIIYSYEGKNLVDETCYNSDGALVGKIIYKYEGDKLSVTDEYFADGSLDTEKQYSYTENGKKDSITTFSGSGELLQKEIFRYGPDGFLSEITTYGSDNRPTNRTILRHDDKGNFTKVTSYAVARKFGTTVNDMTSMSEAIYEY